MIISTKVRYPRVMDFGYIISDNLEMGPMRCTDSDIPTIYPAYR